jgi:hypothetical protein
MKKVLCRCRSHCTRYDPSTGIYVGPGVPIPSKTAGRHALEDQLAEAAKNFNGTSDPRSDSPAPPAGGGAFEVDDPSQEELYALEAEIAGRTVWSPTDHPLVFLTEPGPSQGFVLPNPSEIHLSNHGPHALDPTHHSNIAYIENEMRLCEILVQLRELRHSGTPLEDLEEKVSEGLARMWRHKEVEWSRRRYRSVAIHHGIPVVETGMFPFLVWNARI